MVTFVESDLVERRITEGTHLVVDPRRKMRYLSGHLAGAVSVPAVGVYATGGRVRPDAELVDWLGSCGVSSDVPVIVYDNYDAQFGSMLVWILEYLGHPDVSFMEGSFDEWKAQGREVLYRPVPPRPATFEPRLRPELRAGREEVRVGGAQILDVRSVEEFRGDDPASPRAGHIPGAKHIAWLDFVNPQGAVFRDPGEIRRVLVASHVDPDGRIIAYCRTGIRATVPYVALQRLGGNVSVYDGSFSDWITDPGDPVEAG
jgi:thiosulfate/3-mercaptopyruvate sulfurtransferase